MGADVLGGGVMFAIAAALWLVYLVPTWLRRREYLATERNAVRLQQTLRILAETSEVPRQVEVEVTAKTVSAQKQFLREAEAQAKAESRAAAEAVSRLRRAESARRIHAARQLGNSAFGAPVHSRGLRRRRQLATGVIAFSLVGLLVGAVMAGTGLWGVLIGAAGTMTLGVAVQIRLARISEPVPVLGSAVREAPGQLFDREEFAEAVTRRPAVSWTPVPLPQPLHLTRGTLAAETMASRLAGAELQDAARKAEVDRRALAAQPAPRVLPAAVEREPVAPKPVEVRPAAASPAAASRFARMGLVDGDGMGGLDLDDVLNRRRAG